MMAATERNSKVATGVVNGVSSAPLSNFGSISRLKNNSSNFEESGNTSKLNGRDNKNQLHQANEQHINIMSFHDKNKFAIDGDSSSANTTSNIDHTQQRLNNDKETSYRKQIYIENLPPTSSDSTSLSRLFKPFGKIITCKFFKKQKNGGEEEGCGIILFENESSVIEAVSSANGISIDGFVIRVTCYGNIGFESQNLDSRNLYVCGLPFEFSSDQLKILFSQFGLIEEAKILSANKNEDKLSLSNDNTFLSRENLKAVGFVRFKKFEDAKIALLTMNGIVPPGMKEPLIVKFASEFRQNSDKGKEKEKILKTDSLNVKINESKCNVSTSEDNTYTRNFCRYFQYGRCNRGTECNYIHAIVNSDASKTKEKIGESSFSNNEQSSQQQKQTCVSVENNNDVTDTNQATNLPSSMNDNNQIKNGSSVASNAMPQQQLYQPANIYMSADNSVNVNGGNAGSFNASNWNGLQHQPIENNYGVGEQQNVNNIQQTLQQQQANFIWNTNNQYPNPNQVYQQFSNQSGLVNQQPYIYSTAIDPTGSMHSSNTNNINYNTSIVNPTVPSSLQQMIINPTSLTQPALNVTSKTNLYVSQFPTHQGVTDLEELFSQFGSIDKTRILTDPNAGENRGVGFVHYKDTECASAALKATNGSTPEGCVQPITVKFANQGTKNPRFTTVPGICRFQVKGECSRGEACTFKHEGPGGTSDSSSGIGYIIDQQQKLNQQPTIILVQNNQQLSQLQQQLQNSNIITATAAPSAFENNGNSNSLYFQSLNQANGIVFRQGDSNSNSNTKDSSGSGSSVVSDENNTINNNTFEATKNLSVSIHDSSNQQSSRSINSLAKNVSNSLRNANSAENMFTNRDSQLNTANQNTSPLQTPQIDLPPSYLLRQQSSATPVSISKIPDFPFHDDYYLRLMGLESPVPPYMPGARSSPFDILNRAESTDIILNHPKLHAQRSIETPPPIHSRFIDPFGNATPSPFYHLQQGSFYPNCASPVSRLPSPLVAGTPTTPHFLEYYLRRQNNMKLGLNNTVPSQIYTPRITNYRTTDTSANENIGQNNSQINDVGSRDNFVPHIDPNQKTRRNINQAISDSLKISTSTEQNLETYNQRQRTVLGPSSAPVSDRKNKLPQRNSREHSKVQPHKQSPEEIASILSSLHIER